MCVCIRDYISIPVYTFSYLHIYIFQPLPYYPLPFCAEVAWSQSAIVNDPLWLSITSEPTLNNTRVPTTDALKLFGSSSHGLTGMKDLELVLLSPFLFHSSFHIALIFSSVSCYTGILPFSVVHTRFSNPLPPIQCPPSLSSFFLLFSLLPYLRLRPAYRRMHILAGLVMHRAWPWHACLPACLTSECPPPLPPQLLPSLLQTSPSPLPRSIIAYPHQPHAHDFACQSVLLLVHNK